MLLHHLILMIIVISIRVKFQFHSDYFLMISSIMSVALPFVLFRIMIIKSMKIVNLLILSSLIPLIIYYDYLILLFIRFLD